MLSLFFFFFLMLVNSLTRIWQFYLPQQAYLKTLAKKIKWTQCEPATLQLTEASGNTWVTTAHTIQNIATNRPEVNVCLEEQQDRAPAERAESCTAAVNVWLLNIWGSSMGLQTHAVLQHTIWGWGDTLNGPKQLSPCEFIIVDIFFPSTLYSREKNRIFSNLRVKEK